jgi:hypothetical protein
MGPNGLIITDRRGLFSDSNLTLSGNQITGINPPAAIFTVPLETPLDYSGGIQLSAFEANPIPEPSTFLLFGTGLVGLLGYGWRQRKYAA